MSAGSSLWTETTGVCVCVSTRVRVWFPMFLKLHNSGWKAAASHLKPVLWAQIEFCWYQQKMDGPSFPGKKS